MALLDQRSFGASMAVVVVVVVVVMMSGSGDGDGKEFGVRVHVQDM